MIMTAGTSMVAPMVLAFADPVEHVVNHPAVKGSAFGMENVWFWSAHVGNLVLSAVILCLGGLYVASKIGAGPTKNKFAHMIEVICVYLRENTVRPLLGDRTNSYMPFLWTIFFFIFVNNLLGLVPLIDLQHALSFEMRTHHIAYLGGTATSSLFVTGVLAFISFVVINVSGLRQLGVGGYIKHLTAGAPAFVWPVIVPVEIMGTFVKPVALALRLFANMTAGHILLATLLGFTAVGLCGLLGVTPDAGSAPNGAVGVLIAAISIVAAVAINFLELFVALLQSFVFMFLTAVFISLLSHHHDHEHEEGHGHEHAHA